MLFLAPLMGTPILGLPTVVVATVIHGGEDWEPPKKKNLRAQQMRDDEEVLGFIMSAVINGTIQ